MTYLAAVQPPDDLLRVANGATDVDPATWESVSRPAGPTYDGCQSFLC